MKTFFRFLFAAAAAACGELTAAPVPGAIEDEAPVTVITSKKLDFDYNDYIAVFEGNVKVEDPRFTLTSDKMLVFFDGTNTVKRIDAIGHVIAIREDITATCGKAIYTSKNGAIVLSDKPVVKKGANDSIEGPRMVIWMADNRIEVQDGVRLQGTTNQGNKPKSSQSGQKVRPASVKPAPVSSTAKPQEVKKQARNVRPVSVNTVTTTTDAPQYGVPSAAVTNPQPQTRGEKRRRWGM